MCVIQNTNGKQISTLYEANGKAGNVILLLSKNFTNLHSY